VAELQARPGWRGRRRPELLRSYSSKLSAPFVCDLPVYPNPTTRSLLLHRHVRNGYPLLLPPSFGCPCIPQLSHLHNNAPREPSLPSSLITFPSLTIHLLLRSGLLGVLPVNTGRIRTSLVLCGQPTGGTLHCCPPCASKLLVYATPYCHLVIRNERRVFGLL
jgi:hypothetical protein